MRARTSAVPRTTCGASAIPASERIVALRRIVRVPSSVSAWRSERTRVAGLSAAELLRRSSRWLSPRSHSMIVSSSSMSTSAPVSSSRHSVVICVDGSGRPWTSAGRAK